MKKFSKVFIGSFLVAYGLFISSMSFAQVEWKEPLHFLYKGTMKVGKKNSYITMGFYWDNNNGNVSGEYYYGNGKNGTINFVGNYESSTKELIVNEYVTDGSGNRKFTGSFIGNSSGGWYKGTWANAKGVKMYGFALKLIKVYKR